MSAEVAKMASQPEDGYLDRRREYRIISRVLKEYTTRLYRLLSRVIEYRDGKLPDRSTGNPPLSVIAAIRRYQSIESHVKSAALYASQMTLHYRLTESESSVLSIRIADVEEALFRLSKVVAIIVQDNPSLLGPNNTTK